MPTGELLGHEGIQLRFRSVDAPRGWLKADAVQTALAEEIYQNSVVIESSDYVVHCFARIGNVMSLGKESPTSKRNVFTLNAVVSLKQV